MSEKETHCLSVKPLCLLNVEENILDKKGAQSPHYNVVLKDKQTFQVC